MSSVEATANAAAELKQQGALEAARDPASTVDSQQAQDVMKEQAQKAGAAAFQFDPDATPEQKAAQMKQAAQVGPPTRQHQTAALVTDQDDGETAGYDLPPPSKEGALSVHTEGGQSQRVADEEEKYSKVGWAPRFGNPGDKEKDEGTLLDHQTFLEGKLDDKFFGDWYHNAGVIIFACLASWTVAVLGGGLAWVFIVMAACGTYYRTSIRRVRRNYRDDVHRELAKNRLDDETESLEWINSFLVKFWPIYAPVLCATIVSSVDQVLSTSTPAFLDSMRMKFFTLGTKPPRLEHVKTYPKADDDTVMMDWRFSFTPNDTADLTARQIKNKVNPKVVLEIRIGKAMISKGMDIIVEDMACTGIMRVKMKLQLPFPHIEKVEICFTERPVFDYVCKPIGGDMLGFDINFIPGLESFISEQIHANLGPMMYAPNVFPIEIAKMLAGNPVDQAIGVLQVTFHGAQGLKNPDKFAGTPDPYAVVTINNREVLGKTKTVKENANPKWSETVNIVLTSLKEPLAIQVFDYNEFRKDKELGTCTFNLEQLETQTEHTNQQLTVVANGRERGVVQADIRFFPVLEGRKLADGTQEPPPESQTGIAKFTVEQAKDLDGTKSLIGALNPYAVLLLNGKEIQISQKLKRTNNPIWPNATKELLISDRKSAKLGVVIKDDRDIAADPILGTYQIKLDDMLDLMSKGQEWYNLAGAKTGRAKMMLQWKPVALKGGLSSGGGYVDPIGVMRFHFQSAKDLKNLDTVGKSDPYARVLLSGIQKGRTVTFKNNLNPEWDEIFYVPVHSTREKLTVEVMDEENTGKDRTMGQLEIAASEYIHQNEDGEYAVLDSKDKVISAQVRIGNNPPKGTLNFTVAFYPCLNVADPEEESEQKAVNGSVVDSIENGTATKTPTHNRTNTATSVSSVKTLATSTSKEKVMQKVLAANENDQTEVEDVQHAEVRKIKIGVDDLKNYESGLLIFKILDGQLAHSNTYLEVLMDDMLFPAYTSAKAKAGAFTFDETGDAMVRELDLSRITLRLVSEINRKGSDDESDSIRAKIVGSTMETLKRALYKPTQISLKDQHGHDSKITVSMRYLPVKMNLDPSESFNNSGNLRVEVLDGADLPAADRNGYSDPYCKFKLDGKDVFKTKVQKKTLHPAWNEFFEVPVRSRTASKFTCDVFDWDMGGGDDHLGATSIPLGALEPFSAQEVTLPLDGKSGAIRLKMVFKPDYVTRSRQGSSTFSGTFNVPGKIVGAPVKGVGKGVGLVGGGVVKGAGFLGRGFKKRGSEVPEDVNGNVPEMRNTSMEVPAIGVAAVGAAAGAGGIAAATTADPTRLQTPGGENGNGVPASAHQRAPSSGGMSMAPGAEVGTATITVVGVSGFNTDHKVEVHVTQESSRGTSKVLKTDDVKPKGGDVQFKDETKRLQCNSESTFRVQVKEHKTFGSGDTLGEADFFLRPQGEQQITAGPGIVIIQTNFQAADAASTVGSTMDSPVSRKGGLGRFSTRRERSVTPSN
ncbi:Hypothetical protein R9X50_00356800 [Acrodontium crateriforme]|uniref:Tricalbin n=1 Tax=Acrodontium crateriforme TaxID=150365 RepID=A0AAQ3M3V6_9PEZI|nr:Hypothetical protein R9X50_00356800 [Acrodontium crateriforme]